MVRISQSRNWIGLTRLRKLRGLLILNDSSPICRSRLKVRLPLPLCEAILMIKDEIRKELDIWLGASWTKDLYDSFVRRRLDGTCDWILSRPMFLDWISPDFP